MRAKIGKTIKEKCSEAVEFVELGEILDYEQPTKYIVKSTHYDDRYPTPVLTAGKSFILGYTNETEGIKKASVNSPVIIFDDFTTANKWVDFHFKTKSSAMKILVLKNKNKVLLRYVFYAIQCIEYKPTNHSRQWISKYSKLKIPIPSLSVQEQIITTLDAYTNLKSDLCSNLTTEYNTRKEQYENYSSKLLSVSGDSRILSDICNISRGRVISKDYLKENPGEFPVYSSQTTNQGTFGNINTYDYDGEYLTWTTDGANAGSVFYRNGKFSITNVCGLLQIKAKDVDPKYLAHILSINTKKYVSAGGGNPKLMSNVMASIEIPIPSLKDQTIIVSRLDKYEKLLCGLSQKITKEIELRCNQYEYYRDKLLTFNEYAR